jgi:chemotaxis protein CheD
MVKPELISMASENKSQILNVPISGLEVGKAPQVLRTVLGSCVAVVLYDKAHYIGGLAHIFLPSKANQRKQTTAEQDGPAKYADVGVPGLYKKLVDAGAHPRHIIAHVIGGNNPLHMKNPNGVLNVGQRNVDAVMAELKKLKILVMMSEVGKDHGVRVEFHLSNGDLISTPLQRTNAL